jgi:hypothetical protein
MAARLGSWGRRTLLLRLLGFSGLLMPLVATADDDHGAPREVRVYRGLDCGPLRKTAARRWVRSCRAEAQATVRWGKAGAELVPLSERLPPRLKDYPLELAEQWRTCPWQPAAQLDGWPDHWLAYEDPAIGRCYVWRPMPPEELERLAAKARFDLLAHVHPWLASALKQLTIEAAREGIEVRMVSGNRGPVAATATVHMERRKVGRKVRRVRVAGEREISMHPIGLAVDINLGWRKPLGNPVGDYRRHADVRRSFDRLGAMGEALGVFWLGRKTVREIQHFEHHPGWSGALRGAVLSRVLERYRAGGLPAVWGLLQYSPETKSTFAALRDPQVPLAAEASAVRAASPEKPAPP